MPVCNFSYLQVERGGERDWERERERERKRQRDRETDWLQKSFKITLKNVLESVLRWKTFHSPKKILLNEKFLPGRICTRHSWHRWQQQPTALTSFLCYLLTNSKVFLFRLHCKTRDKRFIVYYLVMDVLGRIAKLTRNRGFEKFVDVISVLNGNMKHARAIEFD